MAKRKRTTTYQVGRTSKVDRFVDCYNEYVRMHIPASKRGDLHNKSVQLRYKSAIEKCKQRVGL